MPARTPPWSRSAERAELLALYAEADALTDGCACTCTTGSDAERRFPRCCHFGVTGREPYPTAVEIAELRHALRASGMRAPGPTARTHLPVVRDATFPPDFPAPPDARPCPLLSPDGRCRVYRSRPFGCRTFFCSDAEGPVARGRTARDAASAISRRIADLSARFEPRDPRPRPLTRALSDAPDGRQPRHNRGS
jgi:uncharacterized protein